MEIKRRKCSKCKELKPLSLDNFQKDKNRKCGFGYICHPCEKIRTKERYLRNPRLGRYKLLTDKQKANRLVMASNYRKTEKGRAIFMLKAYETYDKKTGKEFNLDQDFLINHIFTKCCSYCGDSNNIGCDRVDNSIGHIKSNVIPCCSVCNIVRGDHFTVEEMKEIGATIKSIRAKRSGIKIKWQRQA